MVARCWPAQATIHNIEALPFSGSAGRFRRRSQKTIYAAHAVTGRVLDGVCFDLNFISAAQIDATIQISGAVEFNMQLEVLEFGIIDQLRTVPRAYQITLFDLPYGRTWVDHLPRGEIFSVEQLDGLSPLWRRASL